MTERMRKILRGFGIAPKSADELALMAAMQEMSEAIELPSAANLPDGKVLTTLNKSWVAGDAGGGSDLPDVTDVDNGKLLGVVEGAWGKMDAPATGTVFVPFTVDAGGTSASTTAQYSDVAAAVAAGKNVIATVDVGSNTIVYAPLRIDVAGGDIHTFMFVAIADMGSGGTHSPLYMSLIYSPDGCAVSNFYLAVATQ